MAPVKKEKEPVQFCPSVPDETTKELISPETLPRYQGDGPCVEIDAAYQLLEDAKTAEDFYRAFSVLVFHARHLSPFEHANLAHRISHPFKRKQGKPENTELKREAYDYAWACQISLFKNTHQARRLVISGLVDRYKTSFEIVGRAMREAEAIVASEKSMKK